jgi:hypothetical protein
MACNGRLNVCLRTNVSGSKQRGRPTTRHQMSASSTLFAPPRGAVQEVLLHLAGEAGSARAAGAAREEQVVEERDSQDHPESGRERGGRVDIVIAVQVGDAAQALQRGGDTVEYVALSVGFEGALHKR